MCIGALLLVAAQAEKDLEKKIKSKAVPLEKKLDKRGLLNLGYGYGINGLDVGYIGGGHLGGAYHGQLHHEGPAHHVLPAYGHYGGHSSPHHFEHQHYEHHPEIYLGHNVQKTVTVLKGVPQPYEGNLLI